MSLQMKTILTDRGLQSKLFNHLSFCKYLSIAMYHLKLWFRYKLQKSNLCYSVSCIWRKAGGREAALCRASVVVRELRAGKETLSVFGWELTVKKSADFLCLTIFRLSYKKMRFEVLNSERMQLLLLGQLYKYPSVKRLQIWMCKQANCSISKTVHTTVPYCTVAFSVCFSNWGCWVCLLSCAFNTSCCILFLVYWSHSSIMTVALVWCLS